MPCVLGVEWQSGSIEVMEKGSLDGVSALQIAGWRRGSNAPSLGYEVSKSNSTDTTVLLYCYILDWPYGRNCSTAFCYSHRTSGPSLIDACDTLSELLSAAWAIINQTCH